MKRSERAVEEKDLPEQMMELTEGKIDREQAELLIQKIRVAYVNAS